MNLQEALIQSTKTVKIGTQHGSGFIYIGAPEDALDRLNMVPRYEDAPRWEDREVTDMYDSDPIIEDAVIIISEGWEQGTMWFSGDSVKITGRPSKRKKHKATKEELVPYRNAEGYEDPTFFRAMLNIVHSERRAVMA